MLCLCFPYGYRNISFLLPYTSFTGLDLYYRSLEFSVIWYLIIVEFEMAFLIQWKYISLVSCFSRMFCFMYSFTSVSYSVLSLSLKQIIFHLYHLDGSFENSAATGVRIWKFTT